MNLNPVTGGAVDQALGALNAFAALLQCVDHAKWASLARPSSAGLATVLFTLTGEVESALADSRSALPD